MARTKIEKRRLQAARLLVVFLAAFLVLQPLPMNHPVLYECFEMVGYAMLVVAALGRAWCAIYISGRKDQQLICDGPYSLSRNPLYVFSFVGMIGAALAAYSFTFAALLACVFLVLYHHVIVAEERRLVGLFGDAYAHYQQSTPRFFPSFAHYWSRSELSINPQVAFKALVDASVFLWLFIAIEGVEYLKQAHAMGSLPWRLP